MRRECVGRDHPCARRPPFGVITVTATLVGFDHSRTPAARNPGASPLYAFRAATIPPLVWPGILSGARVRRGRHRTVLRQLWSGVCEQLSPPPLAVATVLILIAVALLFTLEFLRRRNARMRGLAD